ncbi:MAG: hypothetical protein COV48_01330 [Elusimicrobia bacterium CG11_big_fil_rev_8_21_14_0_20_64_6]|nr:MAG: hypothetical protein COV48_01330 [Elusimicrobia bacterium CG11_big_fil_rev_8_21_14_0_20_64_6]
MSASSVVVTNEGSIPVTLRLHVSTATPGSPWILSTAPGLETGVLEGLWNAAQPPGGSFATPITGSTTTSGNFGGSFAGDQAGYQVPPGQSRSLWLRFTMPDSTSDISPQTFLLRIDPVYP